MDGRKSSNDGGSCHRIAGIDGPGHAEPTGRSRDPGNKGAASALDFPLATAALVPEPTENETDNAGEDNY